MSVGYVGLGQMGSAMVGRLLDAGVHVTVFDIDPAAVEEAVAAGATAAASGAELAATADVVSICVPDAHHVELVVDDLAAGAAGRDVPPTVFVHSTIHPDAVVSARDLAAGWGGDLHDVCVAGGAVAARAGELVLFVGGRDDLSQAAGALLDCYGSHVIAAGPVGAGAAMKLAFNVMTYAQFAASAAALEMAEGAEVDSEALVGAWRHVGQLGVLTEQFLPILDLPSGYLVGESRDRMQATTDIALKDLRLAADLCADGDLRGMVEALGRAMPEVFGVGDPGESGGKP
ncbi:MAG: NAD(P)-dependent oxidoreductase [Actinobacteria bacterium]|nr:NAD(P)-dependent oxidoreductase [Actinomycetota bacterium]